MTQRINLKSLLGREPEPEEKQAFMLEALATIEERTLNGDKVGGGSFQPYTQEYADRKGVSKGSVDLFLDGGMLESLLPIGETRNTVTFGIEGEEAPKGYNHHVGDTLPERPWFGITDREAKDIAQRIKVSDLSDEPLIDLNDTKALRMILDEMLGNEIQSES